MLESLVIAVKVIFILAILLKTFAMLALIFKAGKIKRELRAVELACTNLKETILIQGLVMPLAFGLVTRPLKKGPASDLLGQIADLLTTIKTIQDSPLLAHLKK